MGRPRLDLSQPAEGWRWGEVYYYVYTHAGSVSGIFHGLLPEADAPQPKLYWAARAFRKRLNGQPVFRTEKECTAELRRLLGEQT